MNYIYEDRYRKKDIVVSMCKDRFSNYEIEQSLGMTEEDVRRTLHAVNIIHGVKRNPENLTEKMKENGPLLRAIILPEYFAYLDKYKF